MINLSTFCRITYSFPQASYTSAGKLFNIPRRMRELTSHSNPALFLCFQQIFRVFLLITNATSRNSVVKMFLIYCRPKMSTNLTKKEVYSKLFFGEIPFINVNLILNVWQTLTWMVFTSILCLFFHSVFFDDHVISPDSKFHKSLYGFKT